MTISWRWFVATPLALAGILPVALFCVWLLKPAHHARAEDVLGNAQMHRGEDTFMGCLEKHGDPILVEVIGDEGQSRQLYVACAPGTP